MNYELLIVNYFVTLHAKNKNRDEEAENNMGQYLSHQGFEVCLGDDYCCGINWFC